MRTLFCLFLSCLFCFALPLVSGYGSENDAQPAEQEHKPGERMVLKIQDVEYAFRWCPPGTFMMGSPESEEGRQDDETLHQVTLSHGFWMLETEVTQAMWESMMGNNPSRFKGAKFPVETVSWNDCQEFIQKLNVLDVAPSGYNFSLPTEAQWEYACRAGTTTAYSFGDTLTQQQANFGGQQTEEVGSYPANAWGLRDMHGNVWEWCLDHRRGDYPSGAVTDPTWTPNGSFRVTRGGGWTGFAGHCRSAFRGGLSPLRRPPSLGLRLSLVHADVKAESPPLPPDYFSQFPQPYDRMYAQVWEAIANGNAAEADRIAQECITLAEREENHDLIFALHFRLGQVLLNAAMYDSAHRHVSEVAKRGGGFVYLLALCKMKSGDVDGGFSLFLNEIDRVPAARTVLLQDMVQFFQQNYQPSGIMLEKIDDLLNRVETEELTDPERIRFIANYWIVRGNSERAIPLYKRAIPLYEEVLTRDNLNGVPPAWVFRNNLATIYSQVLGQHQKALEVVDKALETRGDDITLLNTKGLILINAGNPKEAIPVLQRVVELADQLPIFCMHLAYALHLDGRDAESRQSFVAAREQLILLVPNMTKENKAMYDALMIAHP